MMRLGNLALSEGEGPTATYALVTGQGKQVHCVHATSGRPCQGRPGWVWTACRHKVEPSREPKSIAVPCFNCENALKYAGLSWPTLQYQSQTAPGRLEAKADPQVPDKVEGPSVAKVLEVYRCLRILEPMQG